MPQIFIFLSTVVTKHQILTLLFCVAVEEIRVARWFIFKPKIQIWVNFEGPKIGKMDIFYGHLEYFTDIWDIL
jgi:hypothetical protein